MRVKIGNGKRYFYRCEKRSILGHHIKEYLKKCNEASKAAQLWAKSQGCSAFYESAAGIAGGVSLVEFSETPDKTIWVQDGEIEGHPVYDLNVPDDWDCKPFKDMTKAQQLFLEREALPITTDIELANILIMKPNTDKDGKPMPMIMRIAPSLFLHKSYYFVETIYECCHADLEQIEETKWMSANQAASLKK